MAGSLKSGKEKRGISYPRRRMEEMIDQGLTTREMAEILGTNSLQSVRHAVEQIKRDAKLKDTLIKSVITINITDFPQFKI